MTRSRRWYLILGGLLAGAILFVALFAEQITTVSPQYWDAQTSVLLGTPPFAPGPDHPLGTDQFGRDMWSRIAFGARWSLLFALLIMGARLTAALPAALFSAYGPRRIGWLVDKVHVFTTAIPPLLIYLLLLSPPQLRLIGLWPSVVLTIFVLTVMEWPRLAVTLKGRLEQLNTEPFVEGAVAAGGTRWHIFRSHLVPHLWPTLLHLIAAEMARALLVIAQLGIFGVMVGGGVLYVELDARGNDKWMIITGAPEWGTMLADGRAYLLTKPWIPFAPAFAFLIAVVGFNLLSQGLEGTHISIGRIKELTTGRLSRRWRWGLAAVPVALALWYYQGLPWDREAGIAALAAHQSDVLVRGDVDAYMATTAPSSPTGAADFRRWAASLASADVEAVSIQPGRIQVSGSRATSLWEVTVAYRSGRPRTFVRETQLVRRLGRWYEAGEPYTTLRGYHVAVDAIFDPVDPTPTAQPLRWNVQLLTTSADHAYQKVTEILGLPETGRRLLIRLYPNHAAFLAATGAAPGITMVYTPGEPLRVSPDYLTGLRRWHIEKALAYEMVKVLHGKGVLDPLVIGRYEMDTRDHEAYSVDFYRMTDGPLLTLADLYDTPLDGLTQTRQWSYVAEAALLVEWLADRLPDGSGAPAPTSLPELAAVLGTKAEDLSAQFDQYVYERVAGESILVSPAARGRVPATLLNTLHNRARAAAEGNAETFLAMAESDLRWEQQRWLEAAQTEGLEAYEVTLLDWDPTFFKAYVLERFTFGDGRKVTRVVLQYWQERSGRWVQTLSGPK